MTKPKKPKQPKAKASLTVWKNYEARFDAYKKKLKDYLDAPKKIEAIKNKARKG